MNKILLGTMILAGSMSVANAAVSNLVVNGSFEANTQAAGTWGIYNNLTGWTGEPNVELRNNVAGRAFSGNNFVELDTTGNSSISQELNTVINKQYTLSFAFANREGTSRNTNGIAWSFGDYNGVAPIVKDTLWHTFSTTVTATEAVTYLQFSAIGKSDSFGSSFDNVSVSPVPEADEWAMMMVGLGVMGLVARRKAGNLDAVAA